MVELDVGATVLRRGIDVDSSLFPFGPTMISLVVDMDDGRSVEVASIGREGAVGGIVSLTDRRYRVGAPARSAPPRSALPAE